MAGRPSSEKFPHELNDQMVRFVHEYLLDYSAKSSAIRAGYSVKSAKQIGSKLLKHAGVRELIDKLEASRLGRLSVTADRIRNELAKIGFSNMADYAAVEKNRVTLKDFKGMSREDLAAISEVSQKTGKVSERSIKLHSKVAALELLGKHLGMYTDKKELSGPNGGAVPVDGQINVVFNIPRPKPDESG